MDAFTQSPSQCREFVCAASFLEGINLLIKALTCCLRQRYWDIDWFLHLLHSCAKVPRQSQIFYLQTNKQKVFSCKEYSLNTVEFNHGSLWKDFCRWGAGGANLLMIFVLLFFLLTYTFFFTCFKCYLFRVFTPVCFLVTNFNHFHVMSTCFNSKKLL